MSRGKFFLIIIVPLSAGLGFPLYMLALALMSPGTGEGYAALIFDESVPDRRIGELLSTVTEDYFSESTQSVFLDDFGTLREIPLDRYGESVEPFDPRNDGYAEKLRSFFVRDGRRIFFVPLGGLSFPGGRAAGGLAAGHGTAFEKRIAPLFDGIPFSVEYSGAGKPCLLWLVLAAAAGIGVLFLWKPRLPAAASLPVLCALSPGGPPALALGAILAGFLFLLSEPAGEFFISLRYRDRDSEFRGPEGRIIRHILGIFRFRLILGALLLVLYGGGCAAGGIPPFLGIGVFAASLGLVILSLLAESGRGKAQGHIRFLPVSIMKPNPAPAFSRIVLAHFLAAVLAAVLPLSFPALRPLAVPDVFIRGILPAGEEYLRHAAFQADFSWRPLGGGERTYRYYSTGEDGLLSELPGPERPPFQAPPFPLEDLAAFLDDPAGGVSSAGEGAGLFRWLPLLAALVFAVPAIRGPAWGRNKKQKMVVYSEKRAA